MTHAVKTDLFLIATLPLAEKV